MWATAPAAARARRVARADTPIQRDGRDDISDWLDLFSF
jgi:hypothetical protein